MPNGDDLFVARKEESGSSPLPRASVAGMAKERMLCVCSLLFGPLALTPQALLSGTELMSSHDVSCMVVRKPCSI